MKCSQIDKESLVGGHVADSFRFQVCQDTKETRIIMNTISDKIKIRSIKVLKE